VITTPPILGFRIGENSRDPWIRDLGISISTDDSICLSQAWNT